LERLFPVLLRIAGRKCVVVGGGEVALRKIRSLLQHAASLVVVSPHAISGVLQLHNKGAIEYRQKRYDPADLEGAFLVIAATSQCEVNSAVARDCERLGIPVNVVDDPDNCSFFVPAVLRRGSLSISVSTDGKSPMFSRCMREELEKRYPPEYGDFVDFLGEIRAWVMREIKDPQKKALTLRQLVDEQVMDLLHQGQFDQAKEYVRNVYIRCRSES